MFRGRSPFQCDLSAALPLLSRQIRDLHTFPSASWETAACSQSQAHSPPVCSNLKGQNYCNSLYTLGSLFSYISGLLLWTWRYSVALWSYLNDLFTPHYIRRKLGIMTEVVMSLILNRILETGWKGSSSKVFAYIYWIMVVKGIHNFDFSL